MMDTEWYGCLLIAWVIHSCPLSAKKPLHVLRIICPNLNLWQTSEADLDLSVDEIKSQGMEVENPFSYNRGNREPAKQGFVLFCFHRDLEM